ncbi:uncharacterized protein LOC122363000 isoform X2 [Puntigrus tetrazona]|uniref:uncharacterized protein LOC122363000 isoform X2 n=1 Tax=Puntigrus tetrazona TaxID=1606681 RepID=UPI001C8ABA35|nr:uncharacterized protein LOC122363000 isoform X2 [Puntigrus tetrazona]
MNTKANSAGHRCTEAAKMDHCHKESSFSCRTDRTSLQFNARSAREVLSSVLSLLMISHKRLGSTLPKRRGQLGQLDERSCTMKDVQPACVSVLFFFCKGLIEAFLLFIFTWMLLQILFSKQHLEVHLQILLAVGLAVLCFCLVIGCIVCCWHQKPRPLEDKEAGLSLPPLPADHVTVTLSPSPSINTLPIKQQYEELDGDVLDYPSFNSSSTPSEDDLSLPAPPPKSRFTLRRLSSPAVPYKASKPVRSRSSLPSIPKLSLVGKSRRAIDRKSSDNISESSKLGSESGRYYGSGSHKSTPSLHFTLHYSPAEGRLTVTVLGLYRGSRKLSGTSVKACLSPTRLAPILAGPKRRHSLGPEAPAQVFQLQVRSAEELQSCTLRLTVSSRDFSGLRETALGDLELPCAEIHWEPDCTVTFNRQLNPARRRLRKITMLSSTCVKTVKSSALRRRRAPAERTRFGTHPFSSIYRLVILADYPCSWRSS